MTVTETARRHLDKAEEFLTEAHSSMRGGRPNVAASNAVIAGINAKDAICLALVGETSKSSDHRSAVGELRRAGSVGTDLSVTLDRLLKIKTKSQYQSVSVGAKDAEVAVRYADRMVEGARQVLR